MADVLVGLGVLQVVRHHAVLGRRVRVAGCGGLVVLIVLVVAVLLAHKVLGPLVFVCAAILRDLSASCALSAALEPWDAEKCLHIGTGQWSR